VQYSRFYADTIKKACQVLYYLRYFPKVQFVHISKLDNAPTTCIHLYCGRYTTPVTASLYRMFGKSLWKICKFFITCFMRLWMEAQYWQNCVQLWEINKNLSEARIEICTYICGVVPRSKPSFFFFPKCLDLHVEIKGRFFTLWLSKITTNT